MKRKHISLKVKLASALLKMLKPDEAGVLRPVIPFDQAKSMTADQIISRFHFNHYPVPHACGGPDEPWNLDPEPAEHHREITAKIDVPRIAKEKRVVKDQLAHRIAMEAKASGERIPDREKPRRAAIPGSKASGIRKRMNGTVERRT